MLTPVILTWEYPPRIIGELAHYVENLTADLNKAKIPVKVVTCHDQKYKYEKRSELLEIFWGSNPVETHISILTWCLTLNSEFERIISDIFYDKRGISLIMDVQDWHFVPAAVSLKRAHGLPFVFTLHSLEEQRAPGSTYALSSCIKGLESMGLQEADLVLAKTDQMKAIITKSYNIPNEKVIVLPIKGSNRTRNIVNAYKLIAASREV
jgi:1,4-alpha-glucan branching enzyme